MAVEDIDVCELVNFHGLPLVFYVKFRPSAQPLDPSQLAEIAIESAKHLKTGDRDGISYLIEIMKTGIKTPLIENYRDAILKQTGCTSLEAALSFARNGQ